MTVYAHCCVYVYLCIYRYIVYVPYSCVVWGVSCRGVCIYYHGVGRLSVAYPHEGAMRRPDDRDKRGETFSHVFFVSIICVVKANSHSQM